MSGEEMGELILGRLQAIDIQLVDVKSSLKSLEDSDIIRRISKVEVDISQVKSMKLALYSFSITMLFVLGILKTSVGVEILKRLIGLP